MAKDKEIIHAIDRALDILLLLQQEGKEMGVTQISETLGMYKSTVYRTLATLENKGFVQQNPETGRYWLGFRLYSLGMLVREKVPLPKIAYPHAKALSERFNEVVHISVLDKTADLYPKHIIVEKIQSQQVLSLTPPVGSSSPSHCSAVGKCLLAFSPAEYTNRFIGRELPRFTPKTITDWDRLLAELAAIRERGYALDDEELELGLTCVAAPILGRDGEIIAALSLSGPTSRIRSDRFTEIVEQVKQTTATISSLMK
ncbi:IclR family transcriptional regulator [Sporolituus thermophilus]|uniref:Glycerol operon regulatory protein n=1 Tax=Sporolituus thermophilus DSM 23256 TaxID=1123285 RepID=A0A1G7K7K8_9FIRM|nr:IclR family transcriptional regulator [Sporolituus thermophilus]SDF33040.1 transcriptional regulator, IclR family [Sporolituus thermophilus DSM 23256]